MESSKAVLQSYQVVKIEEHNKQCYQDYCRKHRYEHDESDLYEEELENFNPDENVQPTFALISKSGQCLGMISLRILPYLETQKRGRLAIFHCEYTLESCYDSLLNALKPHTRGLDHIFCFLPEKKKDVATILSSLAFDLDRYVWVLIRDELPIKEAVFPEGFVIRSYENQRDEADWCLVRNQAFQTLKGSETPITEDMVVKMTKEASHLEGGMLILYNEQHRPVGVIRVSREVEEGVEYAFVGPVAVIPEYQGKGLGRMLLRSGLQVGLDKGIEQAMLCVNADNERAADLYLSEGFYKNIVMICYKRKGEAE